MINRLYVLWRHYSSWFLYAIIAIGGAQEFAIGLADYLPRWSLILLAACAVIVKLIPQSKVDEGRARWNRPW
jgi:hypothetical protein